MLRRRWGVEGHKLSTIHAPLLNLTKAEIAREARRLSLDASLSHSCYDPMPMANIAGFAVTHADCAQRDFSMPWKSRIRRLTHELFGERSAFSLFRVREFSRERGGFPSFFGDAIFGPEGSATVRPRFAGFAILNSSAPMATAEEGSFAELRPLRRWWRRSGEIILNGGWSLLRAANRCSRRPILALIDALHDASPICLRSGSTNGTIAAPP